MSTWFIQIQKDLSKIPDCIDYYNNELENVGLEVSMKGNVEKTSREMPGIVAYRFNQLQELEGILEHLNIEMRRERGRLFRKYLEHYERALSSRDVDKYVDGEQSVLDLQGLINEIAFVRNKYHGLMKALEAKQFQINNVIKLRVAGLEDITL
jgi:hypothetical protein|tara:strand:+ start:2426 stop:2884 length:459 start_codon:yes stop_codon:yes gene_type:complete